MQLQPGHGWLEATLGAAGVGAALAARARAEAGLAFAPGWGAFVAGEANAATGRQLEWLATVGVRGEW